MNESMQPSSEAQSLIVVRQLPIIEERLKSISDEIKSKVSIALSMPCTNDTVSSVKSMRAQLTRDYGNLEEQRKYVKKKVLEPYQQFEATYRTYISDVFAPADRQLKERIDTVQNELKDAKRGEVARFFDEYAVAKGVDWLTFDRSSISITLSATVKSLKDTSRSYIDRVVEELAMIDTQADKAEILAEYKQSLNVSAAISAVARRHEAIEAEQKRIEETRIAREQRDAAANAAREAAAACCPAPIPTPMELENVSDRENEIICTAFRVRAPMKQLRMLKQFLDNGEYKYESIK